MQISALGHSCVLLDFMSDETSTRILVDPWLSDHAVGNGMGRFPRLRFVTEDLGPIHAVYLSQALCDHLDPYTLVRLWGELPDPPVLILPVNLSFLVPVFRRFLNGVEIVLLAPNKPTVFRNVELVGLFDVGSEPTNEEDVMVLVVTHRDERVLVEADARLSLEFPNFRAYVSSLLCAPGIRSAVYLTTENELTGTLHSAKCGSLKERQGLAERAMDEMLASVVQLYTAPEPAEENSSFHNPVTDLWQGAHVLRLIHGQGLTTPQDYDREGHWQRILFPVTIADRVRSERSIAHANGCAHTIDALVVGQVHIVDEGRVVGHTPIPGLELLDDDADRVFDPDLAIFPSLYFGPVRGDRRYPDPRDPGRHAQERSGLELISDLLNRRFLPYLFAARTPPVLHLLASGGEYRIRAHESLSTGLDFVLTFRTWGFVHEPVHGESPEPDEAYWANDLEDFVNGRIEDLTSYWRLQFPAEQMRLLACLATPLLNADLLIKRTTLHFERAAAGYASDSWVLPIYTDTIG